MGAPPCKEYSRLKMKPGGLPALRTPEHMDGVPNLTPNQLQRVRDSKEIHRRGRALLYAVMSRGGIGVLEQPPGSLAWLEPENHSLFKTLQGHLAWADACKYGKNWAKAWCFASNTPRIGRLAALCNHNIQHESIAGVKNAKGEYLSTLTAEYPPLLAEQIIQVVSHRLSHLRRMQTASAPGDTCVSSPARPPPQNVRRGRELQLGRSFPAPHSGAPRLHR